MHKYVYVVGLHTSPLNVKLAMHPWKNSFEGICDHFMEFCSLFGSNEMPPNWNGPLTFS